MDTETPTVPTGTMAVMHILSRRAASVLVRNTHSHTHTHTHTHMHTRVRARAHTNTQTQPRQRMLHTTPRSAIESNLLLQLPSSLPPSRYYEPACSSYVSVCCLCTPVRRPPPLSPGLRLLIQKPRPSATDTPAPCAPPPRAAATTAAPPPRPRRQAPPPFTAPDR
jgi:hypothetical protein